jgi:hypothetical protein
MVNPYVIKKWLILALLPVLPGMSILITLMFVKDIWISIGAMLATVLLIAVIGNLLFRNPFSQLLEGKGILTLFLDSTGVIGMTISKVSLPYTRFKWRKEVIDDIYDRETVFQATVPVKGHINTKIDDKNNLHIVLTQEEYSKAKFQMLTYPTLLYNGVTKTIITKDFLADQEKDVLAEHSILQLNQKVNELGGYMRDFGRYIVEQLKPKSMMAGKWMWVIIIGVLIVLAVMFVPQIMEQFGTGAGGQTTQQAAQGVVTNLGG